jgi:hypothetical protein
VIKAIAEAGRLLIRCKNIESRTSAAKAAPVRTTFSARLEAVPFVQVFFCRLFSPWNGSASAQAVEEHLTKGTASSRAVKLTCV